MKNTFRRRSARTATATLLAGLLIAGLAQSGAREGTRARTDQVLGGTVTGLHGTLVLQTAHLAPLTLAGEGDGTFTFPGALPERARYAVTVLTQPAGQSCAVSRGAGTVEGAVRPVEVICEDVAVARGAGTLYSVGGTVTGLTGSVVLAGGALGTSMLKANGTFTFPTALPGGSVYAVTIATQPNGQKCMVSSGNGTLTNANVSSISVNCSAKQAASYTVGGNFTNLSGSLTLTLNGPGNGVNISVIGGTASGPFTFLGPVAQGSTYTVAITAQPAAQTCTVANGSGTMGSANVTSVQVTCGTTATNYTVGGSVSGLNGTLVLQGGALGQLTLKTNGSYTFPNAVAAGTPYAVTVATQPTGQVCSIANGSGTVTANLTSLAVTCAASYTVGGSVAGLAGTLTLQGGALGTVTLSSNGAFKLPVAAAGGSAYSVTVSGQPAGQACAVNGGSGVLTGNVTNVSVSCATAYAVGGTLSGASGSVRLSGSGTLGTLSVSGNGAFKFATGLTKGSTYSITVAASPTGQACTLANGSGTVASANITSVAVTCAAQTFTIGGVVQGLASGKTLSLADNSSDKLTISANGSFHFATPVSYGGAYAVTIGTLPGGELCSVSNASATQLANNVTNVLVSCVTATGTLAWDWFAGSTAANAAGTYGATATGATTSSPGARLNGSPWTDAAGNLWLFGGNGYDANGLEAELSDLWRYNPTARTWTFVSGSSAGNVPGTYGTQAQAAAGNHPGGRDSAASWTDALGNLWLFGGTGLDSTATDANSGNGALLNDLWKYSPASGQWTWVGGASQGGSGPSYGTLGVAAAGNQPGARFGASTWTDPSGRFWLFGGYGLDGAGHAGDLNDLWSFSPTSGLWTWVGGANTVGSPGVYHTTGSLTPGARFYASTWTDVLGNLWLFGGAGYDAAGNMDNLNDLWTFSPSTGKWVFVSGATTVDAPGSYGTLGLGAAGNVPGARFGASARRDTSGTLWLVGGYGTDGQGNGGDLNDVWAYSPATAQWTWVAGASVVNASGQYGTRYVPSQTTTPGARDAATTWTDTAGHLWMFGGSGIDGSGTLGILNDLWEMTGR